MDFLDIQKKVDEVRKRYEASPRKDSFNALLYGDFGTGKSSMAGTAVMPVLVHSFDPGGTKTRSLQPLIESGNILIDDRFEVDRWADPHAFRDWEREILDLKQRKFFEHCGTYFLDSGTKWADSMMYEIVKKGKDKDGKSRQGGVPQLQDYLVQQMTAVDWLGELMSLPCDVIVTGHIGIDKDEVTGAMYTSLLMAGKLTYKVPLVFDEKYITKVTQGSKGSEYRLQVHSDGMWKAETRLGGSSLSMYEEQNLCKLFTKAGRKWAHKPSFSELMAIPQPEANKI